ncbi:hypothetical protein LKMONMHP_2798 [Methylobacterium organophilum]|uniref:Uncharacterized protein n=2 Tax=Methylobacterium organophilum TaxID=410 RepID=A0ABQ4TC40_METOR|nr:hypothetical protein LKMONMHP_2798 [Methylobacterium organophilum]
MSRLRISVLLGVLLAAGPALSQDRPLSPGTLKSDGTISFGSGLPSLGKRQAGKTILTPDVLQITGPGSTGDASLMSVAPNTTAPVGTLAKTISGLAPLAGPVFTGTLGAQVLSLTGSGSTGDVSLMSARAPGASGSRTQSDWLGATHFNVPSVSALKAWPTAPLVNGAAVRTSGYYEAGDGGGATYTWASTSTSADDGCTAIAPSGASGPGRWIRGPIGGFLDARTCGIKADGITDDTAALNTSIATCQGRGTEGKPVCRVALPSGQILHRPITLSRGIDLDADPRGTTLLAAAGTTAPGVTIACAHDGFDYYASGGAPPCQIRLGNLILKHPDKNDAAGRNVAHGLAIQSPASNPVYTVVKLDNLEIFSPPGDGLNASGWWNGFAVINKLYVNGAYRDNVSVTGAYDWRMYAVDLIYAGRDNILFNSSGGFNVYGLKAYAGVRRGVVIYDQAGAPGVNYIYGLSADNNGEHNIWYDSQDPYSAWGIYGGNTDRAGSFLNKPNQFSDIYMAGAANSRLTIGGNFRFNAGYKTASGSGQTSKFAIEFDPNSSATVRVDDTLFGGGNPTTANGWSNVPARTLGKGGPLLFDGGVRTTGADPGVRLDDVQDNTQFGKFSLTGGQFALYDSRQGRNSLVLDTDGRLVTYGMSVQNFPTSPSGLPSGAVYRDTSSNALKFVP